MFPFSNLPLLPQEFILKQLAPFDLFKFSLISRKCHLLAKRSKVVVDKVLWRFSEKQTFINITEGGQDSSVDSFIRITHLLLNRSETKVELCKTRNHVHMDEANSTMARYYFFTIVTAIFEDDTRDIVDKEVTCRFLDVLKVQKFSIVTENHPIPLYILQAARKFESISATFSTKCLYKKEALFLLNDITVDDFYMDSYVREVYKHRQPLKHLKMTLENAPWFTKENLMSLECEELIVTYAKITEEHFCEFLEKWKEGQFPKLKRLRIDNSDNLFFWFSFMFDRNGSQLITDYRGNIGYLKTDSHTWTFIVDS